MSPCKMSVNQRAFPLTTSLRALYLIGVKKPMRCIFQASERLACCFHPEAVQSLHI